MSAVSAVLSEDGVHLNIAVGERLVFTHYRDFRAAYAGAPATVCRVTLDFSMTRYVDGSAIGMMRLLGRHAEARAWEVALTGCRGCVETWFEIFGFLSSEGIWRVRSEPDG